MLNRSKDTQQIEKPTLLAALAPMPLTIALVAIQVFYFGDRTREDAGTLITPLIPRSAVDVFVASAFLIDGLMILGKQVDPSALKLA